MPTWGAGLSEIDFDNIKYFVRSTEKQAASWEELPEEIECGEARDRSAGRHTWPAWSRAPRKLIMSQAPTDSAQGRRVRAMAPKRSGLRPARRRTAGRRPRWW